MTLIPLEKPEDFLLAEQFLLPHEETCASLASLVRRKSDKLVFILNTENPVVSIRPSDYSTTGDTCNGHSTTGDTCDGHSTTGGKVAVIFGNERTGLTDEQLDQCNLGVTIPSSDNFGSLNLSHAVQIMSYHLFRRALLQKKGEYRGYTPLTLERVDRTVQTITDNMQKIGFFKMPGREDMENFWRSILSRASLSEGEAQYLEKTFDKMAGLAGKNSGK